MSNASLSIPPGMASCRNTSSVTVSGSRLAPGPHTVHYCTLHCTHYSKFWSALSTQCTANLAHLSALSTECTRTNRHSALSALDLFST